MQICTLYKFKRIRLSAYATRPCHGLTSFLNFEVSYMFKLLLQPIAKLNGKVYIYYIFLLVVAKSFYVSFYKWRYLL